MDEKIEYKNRIYHKRNGMWYDERYCEVPTGLQSELNSAYNKSINYENLNYSTIIKIADDYKRSGSFIMAIRTYEKAIEKTEKVDEIKYILPRITSCYRKNNQAHKAVELYGKICEKYGYEILNEVLLTSIAAAYCDLGQFENARKCANKAYAINNGKSSEELRLVYKRIEKNTK